MKKIIGILLMCMAAVLTISMVPKKPAKEANRKLVLEINNRSYTKKTCRMRKGSKVSLTVKTDPAAGKKKTRYVSSNPECVSVNQKGTIRAKKKGTAKIKVTVTEGKKNVSSWLKIKVVQKEKSPVFDFEKKTVRLNSGYDMPIMGLGTYSLSDEECYRSVTALLNAGGRLIDTAYMYGNEAAVGRAIRDSDVPREEIFVITKIYPGEQFKNPEKAIQDALDRLDIGYIDMMLLHHPGKNDVKAYKAMEQAAADGKIHSIGLSNWYVEELEEFLPQVSVTPALVQNEIHPYYQENDVIPYIQDLGIVVQGWYPFGGRGHTAELLGDSVISEIADAHGVTSAQVILRWNLQRGVVVIPGSGNPDHIKENLDIFGFELTEDEMSRIRALDRNEKHDWY